ncbi:MAG: chorismate synthase [Saccharofermentanales bacterium]
MGSIYGKNLRISIFGESHGEKIGVVIDGLLPNITLDLEEISRQMLRRAPGKEGAWSTKRIETDLPHIVSGFFKGRTTGTPLCAFIENSNQRSSDYVQSGYIPRPGHSDFTAALRYAAAADIRGGGHFSGRLTAPLMFAGSVCMQILKALYGCGIYSHIYSIGDCHDKDYDSFARESGWYGAAGSVLQRDGALLDDMGRMEFPVLDAAKGAEMQSIIERAAGEADSVGGVIETVVHGYPAGIGDPMFEGMESRFASMIFSIPAVKGVEFGSGFGATLKRGSENNDEPFYPDSTVNGVGSPVNFRSNNAGGLLGGITSGMPIIIRTAVKPTASIGKSQTSIDMTNSINVPLAVKGRHDPCIVPRALPVVDAACAVVLLDSCLGSNPAR